MAAKSLVILIGALGFVRALSLTQLRVEVETLHQDAPSIADVESQLGSVNDTLDKVSDIVDQINTTGFDLLSTFLDSSATFATALDTLQSAADAAAELDPTIATAASTFITTANKTLQKAQDDLPSILNKVKSKVSDILPDIQKTAYSLMDEFLDAAQNVQSLSNLTDASLYKKVKRSKHAQTASKKSKHAQKATKHSKHVKEAVEKSTAKAKNHKGKHAKKAVSLMEERALRSEGMASSSVSVDKSVAQKGSSNPCSSALKAITKANTSLTSMAAQVQEVNGTAYDLLASQILDTAASSLDTINSTVASALDAASDVPDIDKVTSGLDTLLDVAPTLTSTVQDNLATVEDMVSDALETLSTVYSLSDTLVSAVTEAECAGACGDIPSECESL